MDLSSLMTDMLKEKAIDAIAWKTGLDTTSAKSMAAKALPMIMKQLQKNSKDSTKSESLEKAVEWNDGSILDNLDNIDLKDWSKILWHIFGDDKEKIAEEVWNKWVMEALAPLVMWTLWKANSDSWDKASSLLASDWIIMKMATSFLDKDWDGDIKDDLMWMAMNFIKGK